MNLPGPKSGAPILVPVIKLNGGWGSWGPWGECDKSCGDRRRTRMKECNNPKALNGGGCT